MTILQKIEALQGEVSVRDKKNSPSQRVMYLLIHPQDEAEYNVQLAEHFRITNPFITISEITKKTTFTRVLRPEYGMLEIIPTERVRVGYPKILLDLGIEVPEMEEFDEALLNEIKS